MLLGVFQEIHVGLAALVVIRKRTTALVVLANIFQDGLGLLIAVRIAWCHESLDHGASLVGVNLLLEGQVLQLAVFLHLRKELISTADQSLLEDATTEDLRELPIRNHALICKLVANLLLNGFSGLIPVKCDSFLNEVSQNRLQWQLVHHELIFSLVMSLRMLVPQVKDGILMLLHRELLFGQGGGC